LDVVRLGRSCGLLVSSVAYPLDELLLSSLDDPVDEQASAGTPETPSPALLQG
jgi:hypothetical protein